MQQPGIGDINHFIRNSIDTFCEGQWGLTDLVPTRPDARSCGPYESREKSPQLLLFYLPT